MRLFKAVFTFMLIFSASFSLIRLSHAQQAPAANRESTLAIFGGYKLLAPDYGPTKNNGGFVGVDYAPFPNIPLHPKFEVRASFAKGSTVNENTYLFGPRLGFHFAKRFHPYADAMIGYGTIHWNFVYDPRNPSYTGDNSIVYSLGGGVDVDIARGFQAKVDYQYEFWNLGESQTLTPSGLGVGLAYRFGNRNPRHAAVPAP
jgi:opacity protein-like surface antigen